MAKEFGAWVTTVCIWVPALLVSAVSDLIVIGDELIDGELVAMVTKGAVEMTDAVFVSPAVVP